MTMRLREPVNGLTHLVTAILAAIGTAVLLVIGWGERGIYGTVRTMTASGLERKCDIRAYVEKVNGSVDRAGLG